MLVVLTRLLIRITGGLFISLYLVACIGVKPVPEPKPPVIVVTPVVPEPIGPSKEELKKMRLRELLSQAQRALSKNRLMTPLRGSAFTSYQQVLAIDASNKEALWGMAQITSRYLALAESAFVTGNTRKAELMLKRALKVSATQEEVDTIRKFYAKRPVTGDEFTLSIADLSARNDKSISQLDELARKARENDSRLLIIARNDTEGRWIYQQMRIAVDGYRLRGNIEIGQTPTIVLLNTDA